MIDHLVAEPGSTIEFQLSPALIVDDEAFAELCHQNPELRLERTREGAVIIMAPAGGESGRRKTLPFNGYADQVASLYAGMNLDVFF